MSCSETGNSSTDVPYDYSTDDKSSGSHKPPTFN